MTRTRAEIEAEIADHEYAIQVLQKELYDRIADDDLRALIERADAVKLIDEPTYKYQSGVKAYTDLKKAYQSTFDVVLRAELNDAGNRLLNEVFGIAPSAMVLAE